MAGTHHNISNDNNEERDRFSGKPLVFDGEDFEYWKDRLESFFLGHDGDLWDIVLDGYKHRTDS